MNTKAAGRRVAMFRCQIDPMLGPKPRNAFMPDDMGWEARISEEGSGIVIKMKDGQEHFVFGANIQSVRLVKEPVPAAVPVDLSEAEPAKRIGRPPKALNGQA